MNRVLVYIEPCIFRDNPQFLHGHLGCFVEPMLRAISIETGASFIGFVSNIFLALDALHIARCLPQNPKQVKIYTLYNYDILSDCGYSIESYSQDIFDANDTQFKNLNLFTRLSLIVDDAQPDIIITTSQNRYLRILSKKFGIPVISTEFGPLPRIPYPANRFISVDGHLSDGIFSCPFKLQNFLRKMCDVDDISNVQRFEDVYRKAISCHPQYNSVKSFITSLTSHSSVAMLALQPEQWITWEGALGRRRSASSIILEALSKLKTDKLIVTFHADKSGTINPASLREIWLSDPRLELLPEDLSSGISEIFLPFIDELITVSSNLAMSAFLLGIPVRAIGKSFASTLEYLSVESNQTLQQDIRVKILSYLETNMSVDNATFNDPTLLYERIGSLLEAHRRDSKSSSNFSLTDQDSLVAPYPVEDTYEDLRSDSLDYIHSKIRQRLPSATPSELIPIFGRHIIGYFLREGSVGAEFGVAKGYFSESLLRSGKFDLLYSIDKWSDHHSDDEYEYVQNRLLQFGSISQILRKSFEDALDIIPDCSLDFIYIDGYAHTGHNADIISKSIRKLKHGAVVAVHDYDKFNWPINYKNLNKLFTAKFFTEIHSIPGVLTANNEDMFSGLIARIA